MTITLTLEIVRPKHLLGRERSFRLLMELGEMLDSVCVVEKITLFNPDLVHLELDFSRADDPMEEPIVDKEEAWNWAMAKLIRELPWSIANCKIVSFEPDQPPLTAKEREADRNLGDRPFGG